MKYKLYLTLVSEDGKQNLERVMFIDERTVGRHGIYHDIYGEAVEEMFDNLYSNLPNKEKVHPTPLDVDLSPDDEVYKPSN